MGSKIPKMFQVQTGDATNVVQQALVCAVHLNEVNQVWGAGDSERAKGEQKGRRHLTPLKDGRDYACGPVVVVSSWA